MSASRTRRRLGVGAVVLGAGAAVGYAAQRRLSNRWRTDEAAMEAAGLVLDDQLIHHQIPVSDGGTIHAVEAGVGPPIVLVHGVTLSVITWARQLAGLAADHRVIAIDQRGHGPSTAGTDGYTLDRLAEDVIEVLHELDVEGAVLVGHSLGGMVSMTAAINSPDRLADHVAGLALVATSSHPLANLPIPPAVVDRVGAWNERSLVRAGEHGRRVIPGDSRLTWSMRLAYGVRPDPAAVELGRTMMTAMSPASLGPLVRGIGSLRLREHLSAIDLPTLVVVGTRDLLTPPRHARAIAEGILGAELVVLPGTGHMVMLECPDKLNTLLDEFSAKVTKEVPA
ncbi:MAG TPA: alpha/beta fold hydrolase [Acidimicrobiales bacterium]|jgi:pimeloyl-ACP methyl ester carboxylesterase|nr:alpha/beta fold hydrolase [Acidimicrobiales bacterium]